MSDTTTTETPVTETTVSLCRKCDLNITMLGGVWTDPDGCTGCMFPADSAYHPHDPVCPPSSVVLIEQPWFEVDLGDCVLHDGCWVLLEAMWPATDDSQWLGITVRYGGESRHCQVQAGRATVVKRYITEG